MPKISVNVRVKKSLLKQGSERFHLALEAFIEHGATLIQEQTQQNIISRDLVDTGLLVNSVFIEKVGPAHWRVEVGAFYGIFHEYGTIYIPARPFLGPACDKIMPDIVNAVGQLIEQEFS